MKPWKLAPMHYDIIVLAQQNRLDNVLRGMRPRPTTVDTQDIFVGVLIFGIVVVLLGLVALILGRRDRHRLYSSPLGLFLGLCKTHGLAWRERWLLWRLARAQRLHDPARLFLEPQRLTPAGLGPWFRARAGLLGQLRAQLFVGLKEDLRH